MSVRLRSRPYVTSCRTQPSLFESTGTALKQSDGGVERRAHGVPAEWPLPRDPSKSLVCSLKAGENWLTSVLPVPAA
jgi:hypothetical protein